MDADREAQLRLLGEWLEEECGAALRSSSFVDGTERDDAAVDLTLDVTAPNRTLVVGDSQGESTVIRLPDNGLTGHRDIAGKRRWPFIVVGAAAMLVVVLVLSFGNGGNVADEENISTADRQQPEPTLSSQGPDAGSGIGGPAVPTVVLADFEGTPVDTETFSTEVVATEVVASSIGNLRWTTVSVDPPMLVPFVSTPVGFALVTGDGQLLLSDDAVEWRTVMSPFPGSLGSLFQGEENRYHLNTTEEGGDMVRWISTDFVTWTQEGHAAAFPRGVDEWIEGPGFLDIRIGDMDDVETPEGAILTNMSARVDWDTLALQAGGEDFRQRLAEGAVLAGISRDPKTGIVDIDLWASLEEENEYMDQWPNGPQPQPSGVQFRISISGELDAWVVEIEDLATSETLGSIRGSVPGLGPEDRPRSGHTLDDVLATLTSTGIGAFFLSTADGLELVDHPPWVSLRGSWPEFVMTDGYLYAYYDSGSWRSADGRSWQPLETGPVPSVHRSVEGPGGVIVAEAFGDLGPAAAAPAILRSTDGITWAPPSQPPVVPDGGISVSHVMAADSGFFLIVISDQGVAQWTSVDGDIWEPTEPVSVPDLPRPEAEVNSNGNIAVITLRGAQGRSTAWIVEIIPTQ